jgi:aminoglycoside phosphotransferase (APT) family kinase protein
MAKRKSICEMKSRIVPGSSAVDSGLVLAVRQLLAHGLPESFQRSCVRIGGFEPLSGGLKADMVGGLDIHVYAVMKVGDEELLRHAALMEGVNSRHGRIFPEILHTQKLTDGRMLLVMEECRKHVSLLRKVYTERATKAELERLVERVVGLLRKIHTLGEDDVGNLPTTQEPFAGRIRAKLGEVIEHDPELEILMLKAGIIGSVVVPPLHDLLGMAEKLAERAAAMIQPRLIHGDPHLANIMVRRNGKTGYRMRLIDPNPEIGFSQPIYDLGKLLHWAEPVGWAKVRPVACLGILQTSATSWRLDPTLNGIPAAAERRRQWVESAIREHALKFGTEYGALLSRMVALSTASAHLGMAAILVRDERQRAACRFVMAHALRNLVIATS